MQTADYLVNTVMYYKTLNIYKPLMKLRIIWEAVLVIWYQ